jgi:hypothetical protein
MFEEYKKASARQDAPKLALSGMGLTLCAPEIHGVARLVLMLLSFLSPTRRESLLFGSSPWHSLVQRAVQRFLGLKGSVIADI